VQLSVHASSSPLLRNEVRVGLVGGHDAAAHRTTVADGGGKPRAA
jgi:hypothetical protein